MNFTPQQEQAIAARGNVVVIAGAGTGKTRTLVERCVRQVLDPAEAVSLEEMLVVTFTEAAAAEIRQRIRQRLESELDARAYDARLVEQLALLDTARISTLHSFCLELVREHFFELNLDPQLSVLSEEQARLLETETLDDLLDTHYAGQSPANRAVQNLIRSHGRGWEVPIRDLVKSLHSFTQTRPDPTGWFERQLRQMGEPDAAPWLECFDEACRRWIERWLPILQRQHAENTPAKTCAELLASFPPPALPALSSRGQAGISPYFELLQRVRESDGDEHWPKRRKTVFREPLIRFYEEAEFLASQLDAQGRPAPILEDWNWARAPMRTLLELAQEFSHAFATAKRELGVLDFHDLEQFVLQLLWDSRRNEPTPLALRCRGRFRFIYVDEYQDINAAQDRILAALSHDAPEGNRFLVGDVKQSIYRFRQAEPRLFQSYAEEWRQATGAHVIALTDNFRSAAPILEALNGFFATLMRRDMGGIAYDDDARLRFGARAVAPTAAAEQSAVEVLLRLHEPTPEESTDDDEPRENLSAAEREARMIGTRLRELVGSGRTIYDAEGGGRRPMAWRDIVILLRSPRAKVESYAKEFARLGIPLHARRSGFFDSIEVLDLVNLLRVLDNPLQDIPVLAVLRSPLVGLTLDELAMIRVNARKVRFWTALLRWRETQRTPRTGATIAGPPPAVAGAADPIQVLRAKVDLFLERFERWRALGRHASLSQRLETIMDETGYGDWLLTQARGPQRQANIQLLLRIARQFDELQQQGLYRFLKMIDAEKDAVGDREPAPVESDHAVRLMSIHQSKGLEFPVVVVGDLGKRFNLTDTKASILLDEELGVSPQIKPPQTEQRYASISYWSARQRQREESLGEETRLLYVALTRAQELLILAGTTSRRAHASWAEKASAPRTTHDLLQAGCSLDWLGPWFAERSEATDWGGQRQGQAPLFSWRVHDDDEVPRPEPAAPAQNVAKPDPFTDSEAEALENRLSWKYRFLTSTTESAKLSVTAIRRRINASTGEEAKLAPFAARSLATLGVTSSSALTRPEMGLAHHRFLEHVDLSRADSERSLRAEADRLTRAGLLSAAEADALAFNDLARFWESRLGSHIRKHAALIKREWPFTVRLGAEDLPPGTLDFPIPAGEFVVVQGVLDLVIDRPEELVVLDFKTDDIRKDELAAKREIYAPQLLLYSLALEKVTGRRVTERWIHFLRLGQTVRIA